MQQTNHIRVMVVDDSIVARKLIIQGLSSHPNIEVVGYAINTYDAKKKIPMLNPDAERKSRDLSIGFCGISALRLTNAKT